MKHRQLGNSDLQLPVITFGAWAIGGLFWGGNDDHAAIKAIEAEMKAMGIKLLEPGLGVIYVPGEEDLKNCVQLGERIARSL